MISSYREALSFIYSYVDYEHKGPEAFAPSLSRVAELLDALGNPHHSFASLLIAGTKGKGSTAAMAESMLRAAGYRTGMYTSPHLHTFRERIRVGGQMISGAEMAELTDYLRPAVERIPGITPFEIITALSFTHFLRNGVEVAILEVGLGGRLDATNIVEPAVAVITSISYDHTQLLGNTLTSIAREKAGIVKPDALVVSAAQEPEPLAVIEAVCREKRAELILVGRDWAWEATSSPGEGRPDWWRSNLRGQRFAVRRATRPGVELPDLWIPLLGRHQLVNATTAIAATWHMERAGFLVCEGAMREGLASVCWPGRFEILSTPANGLPPVILDGAHNGDSSLKLKETLQELFPDRRVVLIFGASNDKDIRGMLGNLLPAAWRTIATSAHHPRAADPQEIKNLAGQFGYEVEAQADMSVALERALQLAGENELICVTGSIFAVADARRAWARIVGETQPETDPLV